MFEKLKAGLRSLFGVKSDKVGKNKKKSAWREGKCDEAKRGNKPKNSEFPKRKKGRGRGNASAVSKTEKPAKKTEVKREIPPMPETLIEVPPCEGKTRFTDLPLSCEVLFGVQNAGFQYCTPIQEKTLPLLLSGRDIAGKAQTGTGKTAAFLLTIFTKFLKNPLGQERKLGAPRALVLAPTRELAIQIYNDAEQLGVFTGLNNTVVFGGMDHEEQRRKLAATLDVLIGTPGRVIDYSTGSSLDLSRVEFLVIDEADRMLDMGFIPDIKRIVGQLPAKGVRQTALFSATLDNNILRLGSGWLADPEIIESEPEQMVSDNIEQKFYSVSRDEKLALLLHLLNNDDYERVLIFGNRKDVNLRLQYDLARYGYNVPVLSGDIAQEKRLRVLEKFRKGTEKVVIATDVAARGIHVDDVSLVINYDLPERSEDYIHRIGRTGRAGHKGKAVSFLCEYGAYYLPAIEELLGKTFPSELPEESMLELPEEVKNPAFPTTKKKNGGKFSRHSGKKSFRR